MNKEIVFVGMIFIIIISFLLISGCTTEETNQNTYDTESKPDYDSLHEKFKNAMERESSWANAANQYKKIYKALINNK